MPRNNTTQGISFPPELLARAKKRAASKGISFSNYIQQLIRDDLAGESVTLGSLAAQIDQLKQTYHFAEPRTLKIAE